MGNIRTEKKKRRLRRKKTLQRTESQKKKRHYAYLVDGQNGQSTIQVDAIHAGVRSMKETVGCVILTKDFTYKVSNV